MNCKKFFSLIAAAALIFSQAACSKTPREEPQNAQANLSEEDYRDNAEETEAVNNDDAAQENGVLVVFFSRTGEQYGVGVIEKGNTAIVAEMIAETTGGDMFEILPVEDNYPTTYKELTDFAMDELENNARPEYMDGVPDLSQYDTVFIGAPVWWGDWPMIMYTFFENEDLSGKTLIPFSTHAGSGLSGFDRKLASACPESKVIDGLAILGSDAQENPDDVRKTVDEWISGLEY